jgi:parallel beta-helix repeat protein
VLSGARQLTVFSREGSYWVAGGQTQQGYRTSETRQVGQTICRAKFPRCTYPEDLFIDAVRQTHVSSLSQVRSGSWYFDYAADKIFLATDPTGRVEEATVTALAFQGAGANVTIRGLIIERYATPFTRGTIEAAGSGWLIEDNELRYGHGIGISTGDLTVARRNTVHHYIQLGMGGAGSGAVVEDNEIAYTNNPQMVAYGWAAGGTKWHNTQDLVLRGNYVHHNLGPGLWTDIDNIRTLIESNRVDDNSRFGIYRETSYDAVIRYNTASRNGFGMPKAQPVRGGGIAIRSSSNVEIYGNTLADNKAGIDIHQNVTRDGLYGPLGVVNLYVHDNTVTMRTGLSGFTVGGDVSFYTSKNNRFEGNTYNLGSQTRPFWWWNAATSRQDSLTVEQWQAAGQDLTGTFNPQ